MFVCVCAREDHLPLQLISLNFDWFFFFSQFQVFCWRPSLSADADEQGPPEPAQDHHLRLSGRLYAGPPPTSNLHRQVFSNADFHNESIVLGITCSVESIVEKHNFSVHQVLCVAVFLGFVLTILQITHRSPLFLRSLRHTRLSFFRLYLQHSSQRLAVFPPFKSLINYILLIFSKWLILMSSENWMQVNWAFN